MNQKCGKNLTFEECQMLILQNAVKENERFVGEKFIQTEDIKKIIDILEFFLIKKKLICYGGTAINNILPKNLQFYNREVEVPDYDFYSTNAIGDAKELADIYYLEGYKDVEAKSGVHQGTFKLYVNFILIADITQLNPVIFENLSNDSITIAGIKYASPNFLRMGVYLELSRPHGDITRWEKIFKRLELLNRVYPLNTHSENCNSLFQKEESDKNLYYTVRDSFIEQEVIFFGAFAFSVYSKFANGSQTHNYYPDFSVIIEDIDKCFIILEDKLKENGFTKITKIKHGKFGELIPEHIEVKVENRTICKIYKPIACHNYNKIIFGKHEINIASIDTILSFYLAIIYSSPPIHSKLKNKMDLIKQKEKFLCMAHFLFNFQEKNKLKIDGIFKRFSLPCIGKQPTIEQIRVHKNEKFKELKNQKNTREYEMWFLKYEPSLNFENNKKTSLLHENWVKHKSKSLSQVVEKKEKKENRKKRRKTQKKRKSDEKGDELSSTQKNRKRYFWQMKKK